MKTSIEKWRTSLFATGNFDREELDELESHLLDEMEQMDTRSLSDDEKLLVARHRLGSSDDLSNAYMKRVGKSFTHLSWGLQVLLAFFLLREVVVQLSYVSSILATNLESGHTLLNYGISIGVQAIGLSLLIVFFRYIIKLNYKRQSAIKPNLLMMGIFLLLFLMRPAFTRILGSLYVNYESILVAQLLSYLPIVIAFFAITSMSIRSWYESRKTPLAQ